MRETAAVKARRLLTEGRVNVVERGRSALIDVQGDTGTHTVTHDPQRGWRCSCTAASYRAACSHVQAAQLVVVVG